MKKKGDIINYLSELFILEKFLIQEMKLREKTEKNFEKKY